LKDYAHPVWSARASRGDHVEWMSELRRTTPVFLTIQGLRLEEEAPLDPLNEVACIVLAASERFDGLLHDFLVDDKGWVIILAFGILHAHEDDSRGRRTTHEDDVTTSRTGSEKACRPRGATR